VLSKVTLFAHPFLRLSSAKSKSPKPAATADGSPEPVDAFMAGLKHPLKKDIEFVRQLILGANSAIKEEIKWNSPGFRTTESFATVNLRALDRAQLIFHLGAKVRKSMPEMKIADPAGLVKWLAKDRCMVTVGTGKEISARQAALQDIVRAWIKYV
jgi:Domain of unknown function (DU1801)